LGVPAFSAVYHPPFHDNIAQIYAFFIYYGISRVVGCVIMEKHIVVSKQKNASAKKSRGGRPRKFPEPSQPITVTLPDRTLRQLSQIGKDRAKAIAKAVSLAVADRGTDNDATSAVEIVSAGAGIGLVLIGPSRYLSKLDGLRMVEIMPDRYLLTIQTGTSPASLEVGILDILERIPSTEQYEVTLMTKLVGILRSTRQSSRMNKEEILIVNTAKD
jgi:hypothetical protein